MKKLTKKINQKHPIKQSLPPQKPDTLNLIDKSRSTQRNNLSNKSTRIEKPSEIYICNVDLGISVLSGHIESVSSVIPDQQCITSKNKINKTSDTLIMIKETIQEPINPSKGKK